MKLKYIRYLILLIVLIIAAALIFRGCGGSDTDAAKDKIREGTAYLKREAGNSVEEVEQIIRDQEAAHIQAEKDSLIEQVKANPDQVWSLFKDYCIMGDSRAVGFWFYEYVPQSVCFSDGGLTIRNIADYHDQLLSLNPAHVYLCFGLNDVSIGYWSTPEEYCAEYLQILTDLQKEMPNTTFYVSSILPARDPAFETSSLWRNIPDFSAAVKKMCEENGYPFIDNDEICKQFADLWDDDGIHVMREFYPYWAENMIIATYQYEGGGSTQAGLDALKQTEGGSSAQSSGTQSSSTQSAVNMETGSSAEDSSTESVSDDEEETEDSWEEEDYESWEDDEE